MKFLKNRPQAFVNEALGTVRVVLDTDFQPWFLMTDICAVLGIKNTTLTAQRLDRDERDTIKLRLPGQGGAQFLTVVNEYGLWQLVLTSRKESAVSLKRWLTHEVIPSIRSNGGYISGQEDLPAAQKKKLEKQVRDLAVMVERLRRDNDSLLAKIDSLEDENAELRTVGGMRSRYGWDISDILDYDED